MSGPEVLLLRLAGTVAGAVAKSLLTPRPGAALVENPVRPLPRPRPRAVGQEDPHRLAKALAGRLSAAYTALPEHERQAAADSVQDTFTAAGPLDADLLFSLDLDPARLTARLRAPAAGLSERAISLYDELLALCCAHVMEQLTSHPSFAARAAVEQTRSAGRTRELVEDVRDRLGPRPASAAAAFEERYARYLEATQSRLELYGLTLGRTAGEWPLDTAYISLAVTDDRDRDSARDDDRWWEPHGAAVAPRGPVKAEQALRGTRRAVLRGPAGSGKSTLVQWLALNAARRTFPAGLAEWNTCVPFVLRLRAFTTSDELPLPADFLSAAGVPLSSSAPAGWAEDLLTSGRALVLVDGVDEVPTRLRDRTERWLKSLIAAFPEARYVVTTRPSAVPENWLTGHGFTAHSLLPMDQSDLRAFVAHWHDAARQESPAPPDAAQLGTYERSLLQAVTARRDVGRLATNPLMCALLCALNRDRRMRLPRARKELYDAALDLLLVRRDTERDVIGVEGVDLTRDEQTALLQRLAYWLIRNGQVEAAREEVVEQVGEWLAAMPQVEGDAEQVFAHLLIRSGLLREPVPGSVDFVHRTFQDYLGAKAAVEARDFGVLVSHAHDEQWNDVVRMAVGHARADERVKLLRQLLRRADRGRRHRSRLILLAAASLEHAPELDPGVREEVERRTEELIPPRDPEEAEELAKVGPLVLELLPGPEGLDEDSAAAVVRTAGLVGGDAALEVISRFRENEDFLVGVEVSSAWGNFAADIYARSVLAPRDSSGAILDVRTEEQLHALRLLPKVRELSLLGSLPDLSPLSVLPALEALYVGDNPLVTDLSPLADIASLRALSLIRCAALRDLSPLRRLGRLKKFFLNSPVSVASVAELSLGPRLTHLFLGKDAAHLKLDGVGRLPALRDLSVTGARQVDELRVLPSPLPLTTLHLIEDDSLSLTWLADWGSLAEIQLSDCHIADGLEPFAHLPKLRGLVLSQCTHATGVLDLSPLATVDNLKILLQGNTPVRGEEAFPPDQIIRYD